MPIRRHLVQITTDGDPDNTVISLIDGPPIANVRRIVLEAEVGHITTVSLEIAMPVALAVGQVNDLTYECVVCGHTQNHNCAATDRD